MNSPIIKKLEKKISKEQEKKYEKKFERNARFMGNGVYSVPGSNLYSTDTRELFLMFVAVHENIKF